MNLTRRTTPARVRTIAAVAVLAMVALSGCTSSGSTPAPSGAASSTSHGQFGSATANSLQKALDDTRAAGGFPGVIAEVVSPHGTWIGTSGTSGKGQTAMPTASDATRIGSLTKTMTATVLLQLVHEHKLSLDDTIGKYVPGMPNGDIATLRQLADMTSGIPSYTAVAAWQQQVFTNPTKQWTPQELVGFVTGLPADFAPGHGWAYSNTNYVLLGLVIQQVTGQSIAQVFQDRIFGPLKMTHSSFPTNTAAMPSPHLSGLTGQGVPDGQTTDATGFSPSIAFTAGEVISTLGDLSKWGNALFTGKGILDAASQQQRRDSIIRDIAPAFSDTAGYGIGIGAKGGWWGHDGDIPGYTTSLQHNYQTDTTVIVITNSDVPFGGADAHASPAPAVFAAIVKALP
ncbi:MAG: serine hydrolase domain-containing protein [Microbacteriaceae bacterium]